MNPHQPQGPIGRIEGVVENVLHNLHVVKSSQQMFPQTSCSNKFCCELHQKGGGLCEGFRPIAQEHQIQDHRI